MKAKPNKKDDGLRVAKIFAMKFRSWANKAKDNWVASDYKDGKQRDRSWAFGVCANELESAIKRAKRRGR